MKKIKELTKDITNTNAGITIDNHTKYTTPTEVAQKIKVNEKGLEYCMIYEIKKISIYILLISILNLISDLVQMIAMIK